MFCAQCGTQAGPEAKFCAKCGASLAARSIVTEPKEPAYVVNSPEQLGSKISYVKTGPTGIGGWLMLLVVGMMVLGPLIGAGRIGADIYDVEKQYPQIKSLGEWKTFKSVTWWTFFAFAAISFYGGWGLARGRDWAVVIRAKAILWITGPLASIVMVVIIPIMIFGKSEAGSPQFVGAFIVSVIAAGIWTAYLSKSKRVHNTYVGLSGNTWRERNLKSRGYEYKTILNASNKEGAQALYIKEKQAQGNSDFKEAQKCRFGGYEFPMEPKIQPVEMIRKNCKQQIGEKSDRSLVYIAVAIILTIGMGGFSYYFFIAEEKIGNIHEISLKDGSVLVLPNKTEGWVKDDTKTLSAIEISTLEQKLSAFERETKNQIAVLLIPSLGGENLENYSIQLAEKWKLGQKGKNNWVILLIVKNDRKIRIEVGYGLEGVFSDALAGEIIKNEIAPQFKAGQFYQGIDAGITAMIAATS